VPSVDNRNNFSLEEQYYWDTYFTMLGLTDEKYESLATGMLENLIVLFKRFGLIPNASRMYFTSRSQPPLLTSMIFHIYETFHKSDSWLAEHIAVAEQEYETVWMCTKHPQWHQVHKGLSRYYQIDVLHDLAEAGSGWDMTPRFERKCLDYLPIDLNCFLYKYEQDFARAADITEDSAKAKQWRARAEKRKHAVDELMWGKLRGFYFDYNYQKKELGSVWSLAAYCALWSGLASPEQAARLVSNLPKFERKGGLTTTTKPLIDMSMFGSLKTQWAYPNGWAPLHLFVIEGLRRYGYTEDADRIARKWLHTNIVWFKKHGVFMEKYNVVSPKKLPLEGVYRSQRGFG
jgi:alpha,alpha-trehalase